MSIDHATTTTMIDVFVDRIRPHLHQTVDSIIAAGRELIDAKIALPHGAFGPLLEQLGISQQAANRFMRIASNSVLANCSPVNTLPASVSVLDALTRVGDDELDRAIAAGAVGPGTTRTDAEQLAHDTRKVRELAEFLATAVVELDESILKSARARRLRTQYRDVSLMSR